MIIRALNKNMKIMYYPNTITAHPNIMAPLKKTYSYALGTGALFRKHSSDQKIKTYALRIISRSFLGIFVYMWKPRKSLLYLYRFIGIFAGYFHSRNFLSHSIKRKGRILYLNPAFILSIVLLFCFSFLFIDPAEFEASAKVTQVITSQHIIMIMSMIALIIISLYLVFYYQGKFFINQKI